MFDMRSLIEPSHVYLNEGFKNAPYLSDCMELTKKWRSHQVLKNILFQVSYSVTYALRLTYTYSRKKYRDLTHLLLRFT